MPLHPQARALPVASAPLTMATLPAIRQAEIDETPTEAGPGPRLPWVVDVVANGVPCRLYRPQDGTLPVVVYIHGGGWVSGTLDTHDALCRLLAEQSGAAVLAVGYRLAPEHPYPAAPDDVDLVIDWVLAGNGAEHELDSSRLAVAGDSAGGHLAAVAARRSRDRGIALAAQALFYPVIDPACAQWGHDDNPGLKQAGMRWCWEVFAPPGVDRTHPDLAPLRAELADLPPAIVITAEYDILLPEGEEYAAALADAGVSTVTTQFRGQLHGFVRRLARFDAAPSAVMQAGAFLRSRLMS